MTKHFNTPLNVLSEPLDWPTSGTPVCTLRGTQLPSHGGVFPGQPAAREGSVGNVQSPHFIGIM